MKPNIQRREAIVNAIHSLATLERPFTPSVQHGRVSETNASLLTQSSFSEPLTTFASGLRDEAELDASLAFFAPEIQVGRRFEYEASPISEELLGGDNDLRAIGGDFLNVATSQEKVLGKTHNRGLMIVVDEDEVRDEPNWRENRTAYLMRRVKRNQLIRAITLLSAAAVNVNLTWNGASDPDQDIIDLLIAAGDGSGVMPNRVGYGQNAWAKRGRAHRAQDNAGSVASAMMDANGLAGLLGVSEVYRETARHYNGTSFAQMVGNLVLAFEAMDGQSQDDPSSIKRFWSAGSPESGGGRYQVYDMELGIKTRAIAVGHFEELKITRLEGIRKATIA